MKNEQGGELNMGLDDTHWCNSCKRILDKRKDKYIEFELINKPSILKKKPKKSKGIICQECIDRDPDLKKALEVVIRAGNPNFTVTVLCSSYGECENFEQSEGATNCKHIAVIEDHLYCKRSHPGILKLPREKAEVKRLKRKFILEELQKLYKDPRISKFLDMTFFEKDLKDVHIEPSVVVEKKNPIKKVKK